ncbi:3-hydroxyacyl-CoA dehydrogenase [Mariannaea sp. PMI_226]|nr:3-hydroxyacyl-CoA dehydrogenase [Mariannaea sp. PMI_226]
MAKVPVYNVTLIGIGSIGISFAALHLRFGAGVVTVFDTRPDLEQHIESVLPGYLGDDAAAPKLADLQAQGRLVTCNSLDKACSRADIIQEQGPENLQFKQDIWAQIEKVALPTAHFWTSTSGIAASLQNQQMQNRSRLLVIHPFNPPHIMPLIEIVPSPDTLPEEISFARNYFQELQSGHRPIVINKELPGFVGNRLAFTIFKEASYLVKEGVVSVKDLDSIIETSLGPRFAVQGPFKAYHMGGGTAGIQGFLNNLQGTIQNVWDSFEDVKFGDGSGWVEEIVKQTEEAYGMPNPSQFAARDKQLRDVIETQKVDQTSE